MTSNLEADAPCFHRFNDLPKEIRLSIWEAAIPGPRVIEIVERDLKASYLDLERQVNEWKKNRRRVPDELVSSWRSDEEILERLESIEGYVDDGYDRRVEPAESLAARRKEQLKEYRIVVPDDYQPFLAWIQTKVRQPEDEDAEARHRDGQSTEPAVSQPYFDEESGVEDDITSERTDSDADGSNEGLFIEDDIRIIEIGSWHSDSEMDDSGADSSIEEDGALSEYSDVDFGPEGFDTEDEAEEENDSRATELEGCLRAARWRFITESMKPEGLS
ncbi:uncharacterized protein LY89DRAFT_790597 [Mollisia scopiformis]|uniref:2EXR domain-containing protein n=1 Tax=Mollisia scopiformis TaxID=149040 RepID=A0A132B2N5_MOLSC|nr:uncharacterized protein LY89DRAFT_790597 [Mollisia scopiformis]KUJ06299.1 hypothetical protein LY89DRAFT_790597 [Mollisia scopiformis]